MSASDVQPSTPSEHAEMAHHLRHRLGYLPSCGRAADLIDAQAARIAELEAELDFANDCLTKASELLAGAPKRCWCGRLAAADRLARSEQP